MDKVKIMVDFVAVASIIMLVVSGGLLFFGIPITVFLLKDRLSFWPRQKWRILIYEGEQKEFPITEEVQLTDHEGKPIVDTRGNPVTNTVNKGTETRIILADSPELDTQCWLIKKKIIPWLWVEKSLLQGFVLDQKYLAYNVEIEPGVRAIRVAHLSKKVWTGGNFYPIGQPDMTLIDKRFNIFSQKVEKTTIDQSISAMETTAWDDFKKNRARKEDSGLMKILELVAPVFVMIIILVVAIFSYDFANKSQERSISMVDSHLKTCEAGYNIQQTPIVATNVTQATPPPVKIPFT